MSDSKLISHLLDSIEARAQAIPDIVRSFSDDQKELLYYLDELEDEASLLLQHIRALQTALEE